METVYFQGKGKKLSAMIVTKMALTAKHATSQQYDFQMPSPEEEAKGDKLTDGEGAESQTALPCAAPSSAEALKFAAR